MVDTFSSLYTGLHCVLILRTQLANLLLSESAIEQCTSSSNSFTVYLPPTNTSEFLHFVWCFLLLLGFFNSVSIVCIDSIGV